MDITARDGSEYGIDLCSAEVQKMGSELTTHAVLQETAYGWLNGTTMWFSLCELGKLTYGDFALHIGCDANDFFFDEKYNARAYAWYASDKEFCRFCAWFKEGDDGVWRIYVTGSTNISDPRF